MVKRFAFRAISHSAVVVLRGSEAMSLLVWPLQLPRCVAAVRIAAACKMPHCPLVQEPVKSAGQGGQDGFAWPVIRGDGRHVRVWPRARAGANQLSRTSR